MNQKFLHKALTKARIARGYNIMQFATLIDVSRQTIYDFERGVYEPKDDKVKKIASVLKLPIIYFYTEPLAEIKKDSPTFFRKLKSTPDTSYQKASEITEWHYCGYIELAKYLKTLPVNLPKLDEDFDFVQLDENGIEEYANKLREFWGLGLGPIVGLTQLLERNGIIVLQIDAPVSDKVDINGFSFLANGNIPFVVCSNKVSATRNRFNIAHELAHLLFHAPRADEKDLIKNHNKFEKDAHYFAGAFLFPKERFAQEFITTDINYLINLKKRWGISITAIIERAHNLEIITNEQRQNFYKRNAGIRRAEPLDKEIKIEQPTFQHNGLKAILEHNVMTIDDLKSDLPYSDEDLAGIFYQEKEFFAPKQELIEEAKNIIEFKPTAD